jgi:hypothetical protein
MFKAIVRNLISYNIYPTLNTPILLTTIGFQLDYNPVRMPIRIFLQFQAPTPCIGLSESDSKLYTNFEICEEKNHKHLNYTDLQRQVIFLLPIVFSRKVYIFEKKVQVACK